MLLSSVVMESVVTTRVLTFVPKTAALVASVVMGPVRVGWGRTVRPALTIAWATWTLRRLEGSSAVGLTSDVGTRGALAMAPNVLSAAHRHMASPMSSKLSLHLLQQD